MEFNMSTTKALIGEFLVTYLFLFTAMWGTSQPGAVNGLVVFLGATAYIFTFAGISGAHFNPAVTLGAIVGQKIDIVQGVLYIILQFVAGISAAITSKFMTPAGAVSAAKPLVLSLGADIGREFISSFILIFVIYGTAMGVNSSKGIDEENKAVEAKKNFAPIAIGAALGVLATLGGCFNPAAAVGGAVASMKFDTVWIPLVGDFAGAAFAAALHTYFFAL